MCWRCNGNASNAQAAERARMVQLLRLIEHPEALPASAALRLAQELLDLTRAEPGGFRCELILDGATAVATGSRS